MGSKCSLLHKAGCLVSQVAVVIGDFCYSGLLIYSIGYTWQHLTAAAAQGYVLQEVLCRGRKAHCNLFGQELRPGAAGAELRWQKEPGTTGEQEGQHCLHVRHLTTLAPPRTAPRASVAPVSPCHTTLRQERSLLLLSTIHFKSLPADCQAQLTPVSLACPLLALPTSLAVQPHSNSQSTGAAMEPPCRLPPPRHSPCLCVIPFPPLSRMSCLLRSQARQGRSCLLLCVCTTVSP